MAIRVAQAELTIKWPPVGRVAQSRSRIRANMVYVSLYYGYYCRWELGMTGGREGDNEILQASRTAGRAVLRGVWLEAKKRTMVRQYFVKAPSIAAPPLAPS
jgi:hypothetical protein